MRNGPRRTAWAVKLWWRCGEALSRIGRKPIIIPPQVELKVENGSVHIKGPLGTLASPIPAGITAEIQQGQLIFLREKNLPKFRALHGLARALANNAVLGVSKGFSKSLEVIGVGYKVSLSGRKLTLNVGYSHPVEFNVPEDLKVELKGSMITISGIDKQRVGWFADQVRQVRPPEPYKGKGIKYSDEVIRRKAGKTGI